MTKFSNLQELFLAASARWKKKPAFRHIINGRVREYKYEDLTKLSYRGAQNLAARGLKAGDFISIWSENCPEWIIAALSAFRLGLVLVPLDARSKINEVMPVIERAKPKLVLCGRKQFVRIADKLPAEQVAVLESVLAEHNESLTPQLITSKPSDTALIVFTSGTSGASKGVVLTHNNIVSNIKSVCASYDVSDEDRLLSLLPLSHMLEFTGGCLGPMNNGATIVYCQLKGPAHLKELMKTEKISVLMGTPIVFQMLLNALEAELEKLPRSKQIALQAAKQIVKIKPNLANILFKEIHQELGGKIKFWLSGGAPTPPEVITGLGSYGINLLTGYGLTEAAPIVAANRIHGKKADTVGLPINGVEVRIHEPNAEGTGEIIVRGPNVMSHYFENPEETDKALKDGWLHTGDSGFIDNDGHLHITGRLKFMIVTAGGYNVYPEEIEDALLKSSLIKEACVFGRKGPNGEKPFAVIVTNDNAKAWPDGEEKVRQAVSQCMAELADYKALAGFQVWDHDLPRTATTKVRRGEVQRLFELNQQKDESATPDKPIDWDEDGLTVCRLIGDVMDPNVLRAISPSDSREFLPTANLEGDFGLDSFVRLELACRLEEKFSINLPEDSLQDVQTVDDLVVLVKSVKGHQAAGVVSSDPTAEVEPLVSSKPWPRKWVEVKNLPFRNDPILAHARRAMGIGLKAFVKIYNQHETEGADRLLLDPPFIVAANHTSHYDTLAVLMSFPSSHLKYVHPVAAADYFFGNRFMATFSSYVINAVPFERFGNFEESLKECESLLKQGRILVIFPEGTRSMTGELGVFKPGAAKLSIATGAPIIPAYIHGAYDVLPKGSHMIHPAPVKVSFGLPIYPEAGRADLRASQDLTKRVHQAIADLAEGVKDAEKERSAAKS